MDKTSKFKQGVESIQKIISVEELLSDPNNQCFVHTTNYMPLRHKNGSFFIPSTAMATNFKIPRTTVHATLNWIVSGHAGGSWDDSEIVILAPYKDVVAKNGNPVGFDPTDTYWSTNPDYGLVLPESARIVRPSNDVLFSIGKPESTYKRDNYTKEEIDIILGMMPERMRLEYKKYQNGELEEWEIEAELSKDEQIKKLYNSSSDKGAFLRKLFEKRRFNMLSQALRDNVVRKTMEKMGFRARKKNLGYDSAEHSGSLYRRVEYTMDVLYELLYGLGYGANKYGIMNAPDFQTLLGCFQADYYGKTELQKIMQSIINKTPMDFLSVYEEKTVRFCKNVLKERYDDAIKRMEIENADLQQEIAQAKEMVEKLSAVKTIADYDENLAEVVKRHCASLSKEYDEWRADLVNRPGYDKFKDELKQLYNTMFLEKMTDMGKGY